ncbi:glycosyltransferase family 32 protein [Oribacterium sp. WCC10]|uniref:glycosyltransferase family 32 protein n=1 Tax=Oribacterium sp. WCC10 TaxID=1855343 RepID=UPI0008F1F612|nr:glycosyltransferase [Oribacterium sp. WCC10]SFG80587.1 Glycosyltransferase sugar-binding region containing DXD motif-containing protein [Oribacterium sp. WCC10]
MIPKVIHFCWLSGDPYPDSIKKCLESWGKLLPDYEIKLWSKDTFDINSVQWVKEAYEAKKYAFAADYIRFWALYNYGGIYLDSDIEVLKSYDTFLNHKCFMGFEYLGIPEAATIGAEPGLDWIKSCLDYYEGKSFYDSDGNMRVDAVPYLIRLVLKGKYKRELRDNGNVLNLGELVIYPYQVFSPKNYYTDEIQSNDDTISIHRFASAWGPRAKRKWVMQLHVIMIKLIGKRNHDRLYRSLKKFPDKFNGIEV